MSRAITKERLLVALADMVSSVREDAWTEDMETLYWAMKGMVEVKETYETDGITFCTHCGGIIGVVNGDEELEKGGGERMSKKEENG